MYFPGVKRASSLIFGGPDMDDIYVTTQGADDKPAAVPMPVPSSAPTSASAALPEFHSRIRL